MRTTICLIRGINVGGRNMLLMADLRALCTSLGFDDVRTLLQSGNVVFRSRRAPAAETIEEAIRKTAGIAVRVVLRSADELRDVVAANPFDPVRNPSRLLVVFLDREPAEAAKTAMRKVKVGPEDLHVAGREVYIDYPAGIGTSKLTPALIERTLGVAGTARNWNTVTRLLEMATAPV